eukprot:c17598_g1_i2 orf=334-1350(-)
MVMRRRSPSYSPPPRRGRRRSPSRSPSPRGRYPPRREPPTSLLVRNLPKSCRAEDLRAPFKRFGQLRDVYLPRDYYTGEPRGFGFVQYLDPLDAEEAQYHMNRQILYGRELTVIFAEENRKKPNEMRSKERQRGRGLSADDGRSYYSHRGRSRTPSRSRTPLRGQRYSRSPSYNERKRDFSPESPARSPSLERHQHRSRRQEGGRSGSDSRKYGVDHSWSGSPAHSASPAGRNSPKGSKHESRSGGRREVREHSHSSSHVHPRSSSRPSGKGRQKSSSGSDGSSPERYSRSPPRSPLPPKRGHVSRNSNSRSRSPVEDRSHDGFEDGGASPEHSSMND